MSAARAAPPVIYRPQLPTRVEAAPEGDAWLHEMKLDGYRIGCRLSGGRVRLFTRHCQDWTDRFPGVAGAVEGLPASSALIDGEVTVVLPDGRTSFHELQNALDGRTRRDLFYFAFDLLHLDGEDLVGWPLERRKAALRGLLERGGDGRGCLRYTDHVVGDGPRFFDEACRRGLEGIVSKRRDLPHRSGRSTGWVKVKRLERQELVIGGFTDPEGSRAGIGALLLGHQDAGGRLIFAGKVGTGFTQRSAAALRARLDRLLERPCPFTEPPPAAIARNAHWVRPELVAEVEFANWTQGGMLRHPSFRGLRDDRSAWSVLREAPAPAPAPAPVSAARGASASEIAGVRLTHPDRILFPDLGVTKRDLAGFYESIASWILPHVRGRPLTLVRCPEGTTGDCFYMKHAPVWAPRPLRRVRIQEKTKLGEYLVVDSLAALIGLVQMSVLEIHTWNAAVERLEQPDRIVIDLDPGPEVAWRRVVDGARLVRRVLAGLGLESFVKTTGGKGLHVVAPLGGSPDWSAGLEFSRLVAEAIARHDPRTYTTAIPKAGRERKILLDILRNNRGNTSVAAYSTRARPHAPVSAPVAWDELGELRGSDHFDVRTIVGRLGGLGTDPWEGYWKTRQRIDERALKTLAERGGPA